jgi:hypothetical protein
MHVHVCVCVHASTFDETKARVCSEISGRGTQNPIRPLLNLHVNVGVT